MNMWQMPKLTDAEKKMLQGEEGVVKQKCMEYLVELCQICLLYTSTSVPKSPVRRICRPLCSNARRLTQSLSHPRLYLYIHNICDGYYVLLYTMFQKNQD